MLLVGTLDSEIEVLEMEKIMRVFVVANQFRSIGKIAYMRNRLKIVKSRGYKNWIKNNLLIGQSCLRRKWLKIKLTLIKIIVTINDLKGVLNKYGYKRYTKTYFNMEY